MSRESISKPVLTRARTSSSSCSTAANGPAGPRERSGVKSPEAPRSIVSPSDFSEASSLLPAMKLSSSSVKNSATTSTTSTSNSMSRTMRSTKSTETPMCIMPTGCCGVTIGIETTYWLPTRIDGGKTSGVAMAASTCGARKWASAPAGAVKRWYSTAPWVSVTAT